MINQSQQNEELNMTNQGPPEGQDNKPLQSGQQQSGAVNMVAEGERGPINCENTAQYQQPMSATRKTTAVPRSTSNTSSSSDSHQIITRPIARPYRQLPVSTAAHLTYNQSHHARLLQKDTQSYRSIAAAPALVAQPHLHRHYDDQKQLQHTRLPTTATIPPPPPTTTTTSISNQQQKQLRLASSPQHVTSLSASKRLAMGAVMTTPPCCAMRRGKSAHRRQINNSSHRRVISSVPASGPAVRVIPASEYKNLRQVVPSLKRQRDVGKVEVVTEATRYIDHLHKTLIERFMIGGIPDSLKGLLGTDNAKELNSSHIMRLVTRMAQQQQQQNQSAQSRIIDDSSLNATQPIRLANRPRSDKNQ